MWPNAVFTSLTQPVLIKPTTFSKMTPLGLSALIVRTQLVNVRVVSS